MNRVSSYYALFHKTFRNSQWCNKNIYSTSIYKNYSCYFSSEAHKNEYHDCPPAIEEFIYTMPMPTIYGLRVDPQELTPVDVSKAIKSLCEFYSIPCLENKLSETSLDSSWCTTALNSSGKVQENLQYPEPNALWPNPLLHNFRLQPFSIKQEESNDNLKIAQSRLNKIRLQHLWTHCPTFGFSLDDLEAIYVEFQNAHENRQTRWKLHKDNILEYAGQIVTRRLKASRLKELDGLLNDSITPEDMEILLKPRSLYRKQTRRLYYEWYDAYFAPFKPGGLSKLLKSYVTLRMLQREAYERCYGFSKDNLSMNNDEIHEKLCKILETKYIKRAVGTHSETTVSESGSAEESPNLAYCDYMGLEKES